MDDYWFHLPGAWAFPYTAYIPDNQPRRVEVFWRGERGLTLNNACGAVTVSDSYAAIQT